MTILDEIIDNKKREVLIAKANVPEASFSREIRERMPLKKTGRLQLIAEIKAKSPSKGVIRQDFDPIALTKQFNKSGASAISVLTDSKYFGGSLEILRQVRTQTQLPILRKDFIIDEYQILETKANGADLILLIVAVIGNNLGKFAEASLKLGLQPLIEIHDHEELDLVLSQLPSNSDIIIGVNNRNLKTFEVSLKTSLDLALKIPSNLIKVAESGVIEVSQLDELSGVGFDAVLIGEGLAKNPNLMEYFGNEK